MAQYRALTSFAMVNRTVKINDIIELNDKQVANDLLVCGYIEEIKQPKTTASKTKTRNKKAVDTNA